MTIYIIKLGYMTKMDAMDIYGNNHLITSFLEPLDCWYWILVTDDPGINLNIFMARSNIRKC